MKTGTLSPLHPHQTAALEALKAAIRAGYRRPLVSAPTGMGKTVLGCHIVSGALAKGNCVCFTVPALGLVDQTLERFVQNGIALQDIGVIQADHALRRPLAPVQIATAQTLLRRAYPQSDVVVVDEAHIRHEAIERWIDLDEAGETLFIGLSATPGSRGLGKRFDKLVTTVTTEELIAQGYLSPFRVFAPSKPDLEGVRTVAGDWHEGDIAERMDGGTLTADIVQNWLLRGENRPTLCFAVNRNHARHLHDRFEEAGVSVAYVDAHTPREERDHIGKLLAEGAVRVVVNVGCLTTGIDWDVRCIILARPTKSEMLFTQIIGRGLRTAPGKTDCVIFDHSDSHQRLGFVTDIAFDELDDGSPRAKAKAKEKAESAGPMPKCCPSCTALMAARAKLCIACGFEMPSPPVEAEAEGELAELRAKGKAKIGKPMTMREVLRDMGKQAIYSQLKGIQLERGRSDGWAAHKYRELFEVWPRGLDDLPAIASPELTAWCRSQDIRWAKGQQAKRERGEVAA
jgi:DNA repair protein RadD